MKLRQLRKCRTLVPAINTQYMYMHMGCIFMYIYIYVYNTEIQKAHDIARMDQLQNCEISDKCT